MKRRRRAPLWSLVVLGLAGTASASTPVSPFALTPRAPNGISAIEQRYVYAPPDEGRLNFSMTTGNVFPTEVIIEEPSMCDDDAKAEMEIRYSKRKNEVELRGRFEGLPYRMSYTRDVDVSTPYNQFPVSVEEGVWQFWFVIRQFNFKTTMFYDPMTLQLIGSEFDITPPPGAIPVQVPTLHMVSSPLFEGRPDGKADIRFKFAYDKILDEQGMGGVYFILGPHNLCKPDAWGPYYTRPLPPELAPTWDQALESIHQGYGIAVATSLEPRVKPEWLLSRDNTMIGWAGGYPAGLPDGYISEDLKGTIALKTQCQTRVARDYPQPRYNLCTAP